VRDTETQHGTCFADPTCFAGERGGTHTDIPGESQTRGAPRRCLHACGNAEEFTVLRASARRRPFGKKQCLRPDFKGQSACLHLSETYFFCFFRFSGTRESFPHRHLHSFTLVKHARISAPCANHATLICIITDGQFHVFQRFPSIKLVLTTVESRFVTLKYFANWRRHPI
jgi:hypothetical protein